MGLTDKAIEILLGLLLVLALGFLIEQEISLRHANDLEANRLNIELACDKGSTCAQKLADEAARGASLVAQARAEAAAQANSAQNARDAQAADVARQLQAVADAAQKDALTWQQKYAAALKGPDCATWAKQVRSCVLQ